MKTEYLRNTVLLFLLATFIFTGNDSRAGLSVDNESMGMGMPFGGVSGEADIDLCPQGAHVISFFLSAWQKGDYKTMYDLIDSKSREGYPFDQARFDFQFLEFKEYKISSVRKSGENFEFMLSYGDWKSGNKELIKFLIDGKTYRIIMLTKNCPFKVSADSYF
ncbi:MAG: hypothetical protein U9R44_01335 [Candidatus Omnitrophota bacterium]|nr:hypothetical protein [Candidatus Omnitrophota bacterium]